MISKKPILGLNFYDEGVLNLVKEDLNQKGYCFQEVNRGKIEQALEDPKKYLCAILGGLKTNSKSSSCKDGLELVSKLKEKGLYTLVLSGANSKILTKCLKELYIDGKGGGWVLRKPFDFELLGNYIENIQINQKR